MSEAQHLQLSVIFYSADRGGRAALPDLSAGQYRPHLVMDGDAEPEYRGVQFLGFADRVSFGVRLRVSVSLPYDKVDYSGLQPGRTFKIREGARTVGEGFVLPH